MGRRREDSIDLACKQWAAERRRVLGIDEPRRSREFLGALRSTLGQRRDLHAGSTSVGRVEQHFPEVYVGDALAVHRAYRAMRPELKATLDVHYVARAPIDMKAEALAMSVRTYWSRVGLAKTFVEGWLTAAG